MTIDTSTTGSHKSPMTSMTSSSEERMTACLNEEQPSEYTSTQSMVGSTNLVQTSTHLVIDPMVAASHVVSGCDRCTRPHLIH